MQRVKFSQWKVTNFLEVTNFFPPSNNFTRLKLPPVFFTDKVYANLPRNATVRLTYPLSIDSQNQETFLAPST